MNRLPRAVIGLGAGALIAVPSVLLAEKVFEGSNQTDQVLECARHLGNEALAGAVAGKATAQDCAPFMSSFAVAKKGQILMYTLPSANAFVLKELPKANAADKTAMNRQRYTEGAAIIGGCLTSLVVYEELAGFKGFKLGARRSSRGKGTPPGAGGQPKSPTEL